MLGGAETMHPTEVAALAAKDEDMKTTGEEEVRQVGMEGSAKLT